MRKRRSSFSWQRPRQSARKVQSSHTKRALEAGASIDEIRHVLILLTSPLGFPCVMAALSWADKKLEASKPTEAGSERYKMKKTTLQAQKLT